MVNRYISILIFLTFLLDNQLSSQTILLNENVSDIDFDVPSYGPNYRHFGHLFIGFGFFIPDGGTLQIETKTASTTSLELGWRYKLKLTKWLAIGSGITYVNDIFDIKQVDNKVFPTTIKHDKEKLRFNNVGTEFYTRINFGKRGNVIGRFIDIGAYWNWAFKVKHMYQDKNDSQNPYMASSQRVILYDLSYIEPFNYGVKSRIGINRYVVTFTYRLNDLLNQEYRDNYSDMYLPKLAIGFEMGLFR